MPTEVQKLRTQVWYYAIEAISGLNTAYKVELSWSGLDRFPRNNNHTISRSRIFEKYEKGESAPSKKRVHEIEERWPGTKYYFMHPIWGVMGKGADEFVDEDKLIKDLNPYIQIQYKRYKKMGRIDSASKIAKKIARDSWLDGLCVFLLIARNSDYSFTSNDVEKSKKDLAVIEQAYLCLIRMLSLYPFYPVRLIFGYPIRQYYIQNPISEWNTFYNQNGINSIITSHSDIVEYVISEGIISDDFVDKIEFLNFVHDNKHAWELITIASSLREGSRHLQSFFYMSHNDIRKNIKKRINRRKKAGID